MAVLLTELRIGNWIYPNKNNENPYQVYGMFKNNIIDLGVGIDGGEMLIHADNTVPIPITEDILVKCGFENIKHYWYLPNSSEDWNVTKNKYGWIVFNDQADERLLQIPVQSLHQLQNLYHSLTGQELSITL